MTMANKRIPAIAGGIALVLVVVWYFLAWSPQAKNLKTAHQAHAAAEAKKLDLESQMGQLQGLLRQVPADNAKFAQLQAELPDNPQLDQALNLLHQAAAQTGVLLASLAPSTPASLAGTGGSSSSSSSSGSSSQAGGPAITLGMSVQGTFAQVKAFLAALQALQRTVVVDKIAISGTTSTTATISARIFYAGKPTP